jgi:hypothetical protein
MKDGSGVEIVVGTIVAANGCGDGKWTVLTGQDEFGEVEIQHNELPHRLYRHPSNLTVTEQ